MGSRGPAPKRSTERRRRNKDGRVDVVPVGGVVVQPVLEGDHSEVAVRFWHRLGESGQAQFFEPSDWALAELAVLAIDSFVAKPSAMMLSSINQMLSSLLVSEADRRRARMELEREESEPGEVTDLDEFKRRLQTGS